MRKVVGIIAAIILIAVGGAAFIYSGAYNVAATDGHYGVTQWIMHTTMRRSVSARAASVKPPGQFSAEQTQKGFSEFNEMCVTCHGAPGKEREEIGKGLNPQAPALSEASKDWSTAELFWIVKNGVKMTGMPAFGPTHSDDRIWTLVAFLKQLPRITPEQYAQMEKASGDSEGHSHGVQQHSSEPKQKPDHNHSHDHAH